MIESIIVGAVATNCWIVPLKNDGSASGRTGRGLCAVIDPGGDAEAIIARLGRRSLRPSLVLLTHGHFDHVAALSGLIEAFSEDDLPPPLVAIHAADAAYLGPDSRPVHRRDFVVAGVPEYVDRYWRPMPRPARLVADGDAIGPFRVLHVPGHTPGSVAFLDEGSNCLFSGDTLFSGAVGRTDLPGGDEDALRRSLTRLLSLDGGIHVYPGHGNDTRIGRER
jgi:glyoxylase-like metal-dependent hydrolase (beta-lactamase superfamily II)